MPFVLKTVGTGLTSAFGGLAAVHLTKLVKNLFNFKSALTGTAPVIGTLVSGIELQGKASAAAATKVGLLSRAMAFLAANPFVAVTTGIFALISGYNLFKSANDELTGSIDKARAAFDEAKGELQSTQQTINSVGEEVTRLTDRYDYLNENQEELDNQVLKLQGSFSKFSKDLRTDTINTVEDLTDVLTNLQVKLRDLSNQQLQVLQGKNAILFQETLDDSLDRNDEFFKRRKFDTTNRAIGVENTNLFYDSNDNRKVAVQALQEDRFAEIQKLSDEELKKFDAKYGKINDDLSSSLEALQDARTANAQDETVTRVFDKEIARVEALKNAVGQLRTSITGASEFKNQVDENNVLNSKGFKKAK
jgi:uncharacterized coiled-coil DUF342 family protein